MIHKLLDKVSVVLASASPRRSQLFHSLNIDFKVIPSDIEEDHNIVGAENFVKINSALKARDIAKKHPNSLVVGADTIVVKKEKIYVKPKNEEDAKKMLRDFSNDSHYVYSGFTIIFQGKEVSDFEKTEVVFQHLSDEDIQDYIDTNESMDKAGAYAIQGFGSQFIEKINGDYFTVMGFPINKFYKTLKKFIKGEKND